MKLSERSFSLQEESGNTLVGYPIVWDTPAHVYEEGIGEFTEVIRSDAIDLNELIDVVLNLNHDDSRIVARTKNGSLRFEKDNHGLKMIAKLGNASFQREAYEMVKQELITKMSFRGFFDYQDSFDESGNPIKEVVRVRNMRDVSLVTFPAYEETSVQARKENLMENENVNVSEENVEVTNEENKAADEVVEETEERVEEKAKEEELDLEKLATLVADKFKDQIKGMYPDKEGKEGKAEQQNQENTEGERGKLDMEKFNNMQATDTKVSIRSTAEYEAVWARAIRHNDMGEARRFLATNGSHGEGKLVPTKLENKIEHELRKGGRIAGLCNIKSFERGITSIPVELSADDAVWHDEGSAAPAEENITFGEVLINAEYIKKWIAFTDKMESMTDIDLANYLIDEITNKCLELLDKSIINGSKGVIGILKNSDTKFVADVKVDPEQLVVAGNLALAEIEEGLTTTMITTQSFYYKSLASMLDKNGRPMANETVIDGITRRTWNGMNVVFAKGDDLAKDATDTSKPFAIVGDMDAYMLNCPNGYNVELLQDPYTLATENKIRYIGKMLVGGNIIRLHSFAKLTLTASVLEASTKAKSK